MIRTNSNQESASPDQADEKQLSVSQVQGRIFERWKKEWQTGRDSTEEEDYFYMLFVSNYDFVCKKNKKNQKYNFYTKKFYLAVILAVPVLRFLFRFCYGIYNKNLLEVIVFTDWTDLLSAAAVVALSILLGAIVAKGIDIMKYQETWARHADHKYKLVREMYFFITDSGSYSDVRRKKRIFIEKVFEIWDGNNAKFVKNLEEKEKPLTDTLKIIRGDDD